MTVQRDEHDLLYGMPAIAAAFGWKPRQVEHLKNRHGLPTFQIGRCVCASRSAVRAWIARQAQQGRAA